ncbi:MAG: potassium/proton antiporter, partial [Oligosphaeraceae bacterium]|nr:potassium/proton antiporter [Oligosphaeraceae bacterium]
MSLAVILAFSTTVVLLCLLSSKVSSWLNMPTLLLFLGVGMLSGSEGFGGFAFTNAQTANYIGSVAMAFILFSGGFDTRWKSVRQVLLIGGLLSSLGVLLTALCVGLFAWFFLGWLWPENNPSLAWCLLLGSIISSTDAAAVFSILRSRKVSLSGKLQPLLEFESGSNDPMAAFLTVFMVGIVTAENTSGGTVPLLQYCNIFPMFLLKMVLGIACGWALGKGTVWLYNKIDFEYDGLYYVLAFVCVMLTFASTELIHGNGFMAVYVAGMVLGNSRFIFHNSIGKFYDGFAWLMQVILFSMLGLLSFPSQIWEIKWAGGAIAAFLLLVARPVAVFLSMLRSNFSLSERVLVSWVGLRGGAPIMLATFPLLAKLNGGAQMFHIVFFIVLISVMLQGMTIMPLARWLKLDMPLRNDPRVPLSFENTGTMDASSREFWVDERADQKTLAELGLPKAALVMLIRRDDKFLIPQGP